MKRRVVVTGLGAITPVGNDVATTWRAILDGCSGAAHITKFDYTGFPVTFACEVKGFDPSMYMDRKEAKRADPYTQYAVGAAVQAMTDAGLPTGDIGDPDRIGVIVGSGIGGLKSFEEQHDVYRERGQSKISPFFIPMFIADIAAGHRLDALQRQGAELRDRVRLRHQRPRDRRRVPHDPVRRRRRDDHRRLGSDGDADGDRRLREHEGALRAQRLAGDGVPPVRRDARRVRDGRGRRHRDPRGARAREGARGAKIYAEIVGYGATGDAHHLTAPAPEGEGAQRAMRRAMKDAGVTPADIDYINAHGTSTPANDLNETKAIKAVFGDAAKRINVSSTKSMTGHMLGAAGAVEFIFCALASRDSIVPPTINYQHPDPELDLNFTPNKAVKRQVRLSLSNSFGFGGHNVSLAVKRFPE